MYFIPLISEKTPYGERSSDIFSRMLMDRIIFLEGPIESEMATAIVAQLLYLDSINHNDITIYIGSGGGEVISGLSIVSTMESIKSNVVTICLSQAASMASVILSAGNKRYITKWGEVLVHQPLSSSAKKQVSDIVIHTNRIVELKQTLTEILAKNCGKTYDEMAEYMDRDYIISGQQAVEFGIVDAVI